MLQEYISYKIKTADLESVLTHFIKCDDDFTERLSEKININSYSKKIVENSITLEAWTNTELVGLIAAYFNDDKRQTAFITNVSIIKGFSGKGIASQLMERCLNYAAEHKFAEIVLEVIYENRNAIQLYKKFDFKEIENRDNLITMKRYI